MKTHNSMIIAHRGASYIAPENTLASVNLAWEQNADAVEVDVQLSKDNHVLVIHDSKAKRTSGLNKKVSELNLYDLRELDFGSWKGEKWTNEKIPVLSEILGTVPEGKKLFIEVKCGAEIIGPLSEVLNQNIVPSSDLVLMHFNIDTLIKLKDSSPGIEILWLYEFNPISTSNQKRKLLKDVIEIARSTNFQGINIENISELDSEFISACKQNNLKCFCWTVNDSERAEYLIDAGINGITTDRPRWLCDKLEKRN